MRLVNALPMITLAAALVACGSATTSTDATAGGSVPAPLASVVPVAPAGEVTCDDVDLAGANVRSYVHYVSLNVGTMNDSTPTYGEMAAALGVMAAGAPQCAPDAVEEIGALTAAAQDAAAAFQPSTDPAAIAAQKEAPTAFKETGVVAWTAMAKDPADWDTTLRFTE